MVAWISCGCCSHTIITSREVEPSTAPPVACRANTTVNVPPRRNSVVDGRKIVLISISSLNFKTKTSSFSPLSCNVSLLCVCWDRGGCSLDWGHSETVSVPLSVPAASKPPAGPRAGFCLHRGHRWHQAQRAASDRAACKSLTWTLNTRFCGYKGQEQLWMPGTSTKGKVWTTGPDVYRFLHVFWTGLTTR